MTQWVENPTGGRARGPSGLVRAWLEVLVRPRRFFRTGVAPGDQAPGLAFAAAVVLGEELSRVALVAGAYPTFAGRPILSRVLALALVVTLVTPAVLHLTAALETVLLLPTAPDRGGVDGTVQVLAYATAPCLLAGIPWPPLRVACCLYGAALLAVGTAEVHALAPWRAAAVAALPAALVFGYGFRGFAAVGALLSAAGLPGTF
ncbi:MAG: YIP1 family protein [Haloarculaceae archaeon]